MLSTALIVATLRLANPQVQQHDLAAVTMQELWDDYRQLQAEYPGLERFWTSDYIGIFYKSYTGACLVPGDADGDITDRVV